MDFSEHLLLILYDIRECIYEERKNQQTEYDNQSSPWEYDVIRKMFYKIALIGCLY